MPIRSVRWEEACRQLVPCPVRPVLGASLNWVRQQDNPPGTRFNLTQPGVSREACLEETWTVRFLSLVEHPNGTLPSSPNQ